ncbi:MAG TPA: hypothetical protein VMH41_16900 [Mycobacteriales bacterium]|nr:hypothetical protein [Mycobacteriales bacterium]
MSERAAYSRVYWSIIDDEKFANVYDDDRALATWLRLLLVADQAWPASAHVPANVNRKALMILSLAGLVDFDQRGGARYRIHGLDAERTRRKEAATRPPSGPQLVPNRDPNGPGTTGLRRDETSRDEPSQADARADFTEVVDYLEKRTGRPYGFGPGSKVHETLGPDVRDQGAKRVIAAMVADRTERPDIAQLVFSAHNTLYPLSGSVVADPKAAAQQAAEEEQSRRNRAAFEETQRLIARQRPA